MIINRQRKVILYNMPRTGTLSLTSAARNARSNANVQLDFVTDGHESYGDITHQIDQGYLTGQDLNEGLDITKMARSAYENNLPTVPHTRDDLDSFEQYTFVRDPFERAKSAINLFRRGRLHHFLLFIHYGHDFGHRLVCTQRDGDYDNFPQWKKDKINQIPYIQAFRDLRWWFEKGSLRKGHMGYIEGPVQPIVFSKNTFATEARRVMGRLNIPSNIPLPHENSAKYIEEYDGLSPREEQEIKDYFAEDYEYLDSKGIHFTK